MSSRCLRRSVVLAQFTLMVVTFLILSTSMFLMMLASIVAVNTHVAFEIIYGTLFVDQHTIQLLRQDNQLRRPNMDFPVDLLAIEEMYPRVVKIIAGCLLFLFFIFFLLSTLGCYAAISQSAFMTEVFSFNCGLFMVLLSTIGMALLFQGHFLKAILMTKATEFINNDYSAMNDDLEMRGNIFDFIQARFECCGVTNSSDFGRTHFPVSCCRLNRFGLPEGHASPVFVRRFESCPEKASLENSNMATGCFQMLWTLAIKMVFKTIAFLWLIMTLGMLSAMLLRVTICEDLRRHIHMHINVNRV